MLTLGSAAASLPHEVGGRKVLARIRGLNLVSLALSPIERYACGSKASSSVASSIGPGQEVQKTHRTKCVWGNNWTQIERTSSASSIPERR